jgi:murein DD-endopeptidase MepM/ murein hydrolase activator NlpD
MEPLFGRRFLWTFSSIALSGAVLLGIIFYRRATASREYADQVRLSVASAALFRDTFITHSQITLHSGLTFSNALQQLSVAPAQAQEVIQSAKGVFDLRQVRAGGEIDVGRSVEGVLQEIRYKIDGEHVLSVRSRDGGFSAQVETFPARTETVAVGGEIEDSLFRAVSKAGEGPELALRLAEIFGWDLDFYSDPRVGDTFRVEVEKKTSFDGKDHSYGRVLYAEYINDGHPYRALLFHDAEGQPAYFSPEGKSLQKAFLRSPLKFSAAVTSSFSRSRFHPILQETRAHLGTDYGAPIGTPVQAIGPGHVVFAGYKGDNGNMVQLHHANGYDSLYLHLSRIMVKTGDRVDAGDRIGLVGMTGLATGPHLHFSIIDHGVYRNFEVLRHNLPSAEPVPLADMADFQQLRNQVVAQLDAPSLAARVAAGSATLTPPLRPASLQH